MKEGAGPPGCDLKKNINNCLLAEEWIGNCFKCVACSLPALFALISSNIHFFKGRICSKGAGVYEMAFYISVTDFFVVLM